MVRALALSPILDRPGVPRRLLAIFSSGEAAPLYGLMTEPTQREAYRLWARDTARYGDTDRQGHLNNAVFSTFLETGRTSFLMDPAAHLAPEGCGFVIVRLVIDYRREMHWGGSVEIGTTVRALGRSSFTLGQAIFQDDACTATAETVLVLMDDGTRRARPLPDDLRQALTRWIAPPSP